ncbi:MAG TPA: DinB family protein [Bryobacteraceae bacterium]|jgi:hypothetical protein|nr:DinB family protein [Bryobacteraceae bacterium]
MLGRPERDEAAPYYFSYIDQVSGDDVVALLEQQSDELGMWCAAISEERSLHRYALDKWSIRQVLNHVTDTERSFAFRAFWFARGFDGALPNFDQTICATAAEADSVKWGQHVLEFRAVRLSTVALFKHLPAAAWWRSGIASDNHFTVRSLAYIIAGHAQHHLTILKERYQ